MTRAPYLRLLPALLVAALALSLAPAPALAVQAPTEPEARVLSLVNQARAEMGRVPLYWDDRLADIAQERSDYMASSGTFGHLSSSEMGALFEAHKIIWYYRAEVLVKGTPRTPMESAEEAFVTWKGSSSHWNLLMETEFNYAAFGVTRAADGWYYWTGLLLKGPDRTAPTASMTGASMGKIVSGKRSVTVSWKGADVPLSVLTAGLKDFRLQRRVGSGSWVRVTDWTKATSKAFSLTVGKTYRFRIRARDNNGNKSVWSTVITVKP
jgi:uncharacterized protein YkwD